MAATLLPQPNPLALFDEALSAARKKRLESHLEKNYLRARRKYIRHLQSCDDCLLGGALQDSSLFCEVAPDLITRLKSAGLSLAKHLSKSQ